MAYAAYIIFYFYLFISLPLYTFIFIIFFLCGVRCGAVLGAAHSLLQRMLAAAARIRALVTLCARARVAARRGAYICAHRTLSLFSRFACILPRASLMRARTRIYAQFFGRRAPHAYAHAYALCRATFAYICLAVWRHAASMEQRMRMAAWLRWRERASSVRALSRAPLWFSARCRRS